MRFGSHAGRRLLAFDALVGFAWGAPFGPQRVGASVAFGGEWFSAFDSKEPTGERTASSGVANLGVRWAEPLDPAVLWFGVDGRLRFHRLEIEPPVDAGLSRWSVIVALGGALRAP